MTISENSDQNVDNLLRLVRHTLPELEIRCLGPPLALDDAPDISRQLSGFGGLLLSDVSGIMIQFGHQNRNGGFVLSSERH